MLRRLCRLCQLTKPQDHHTLRAFSTTLRFRQSDADTIPAPTFCEDDEGDQKIEDVEEVAPVIKDDRPLVIKAKRKEFNFHKGTLIKKKYTSLPLASQGWYHNKSKGDHFTIYPDIDENVDDTDTDEKKTFADLGLGPEVQQIVQRLGLTEPTKIQKKAIPNIISGTNTIIQAETGTGKTFTYLLPIINQVLKWKPQLDRRPNTPIALILVPTRELVLQVATEAKKLCNGLDIGIKTLISAHTKKMIQNPPVDDVDILIGTVGITSKLTTNRIYSLRQVRHTVLDEAHALFDETFELKLSIFLERINFGYRQAQLGKTHCSSQLTMASATMPEELPAYFSKIIDMPSLVKIQTENVHKVLVPQKFWRLGPDQKPHALLRFVKPRALRKEGTIIFSNSTATADWISIFLKEMNVNAVALSGNQPTEIRRNMYWDFRNGKVHILSATNSSARGLDTITVDCIINYDFPMDTADYIHRCGRTGRVGSKTPGRVINFISRPLEIALAMKIERAARRGRALPLFDIHEQNREKEMQAELKQLLGPLADGE